MTWQIAGGEVMNLISYELIIHRGIQEKDMRTEVAHKEER